MFCWFKATFKMRTWSIHVPATETGWMLAEGQFKLTYEPRTHLLIGLMGDGSTKTTIKRVNDEDKRVNDEEAVRLPASVQDRPRFAPTGADFDKPDTVAVNVPVEVDAAGIEEFTPEQLERALAVARKALLEKYPGTHFWDKPAD